MAAAAFIATVHLPDSCYDDLAARLLQGLADGHAARISRRARAVDRARGAAGQLAAMAAAAAAVHAEGVDVDSSSVSGGRAAFVDVTRDKSGRPRVVVTAGADTLAPPAADVSLAHHGSWVLAAAAGGQGTRVGVDVVHLSEVPLPVAAARVARHFSESEAGLLSNAAAAGSPPAAHARLFAALWAYKEASWKAGSCADELRGGEGAASQAADPASSPLRGIGLPPALAAAAGTWAAGGETAALDVATAVVEVHSEGAPAATVRVSMLWLLGGDHVAALVVECPRARLSSASLTRDDAVGFEAWEPSVPVQLCAPCGGARAVRLQGARVVVGAADIERGGTQTLQTAQTLTPTPTRTSPTFYAYPAAAPPRRYVDVAERTAPLAVGPPTLSRPALPPELARKRPGVADAARGGAAGDAAAAAAAAVYRRAHATIDRGKQRRRGSWETLTSSEKTPSQCCSASTRAGCT